VPFFLEGAILGILGSGAGLTALYLLFKWIQLRFSGENMQGMFSFSFFSGPAVLLIILLSVLLCAGGSFTSTRKILTL
jgi:cell division transport system permease protein